MIGIRLKWSRPYSQEKKEVRSIARDITYFYSSKDGCCFVCSTYEISDYTFSRPISIRIWYVIITLSHKVSCISDFIIVG
jgi:hypothetical protein